jgi:hypothetical protein
MGVLPAAVVVAVGGPTTEAYRRAEHILAEIPDPFQERARRPDAVVPLLFGLLMSEQDEVRRRQHALIVTHHEGPLADTAWYDADALTRLAPTLRLPLAQLAFSALRQRTRA